MSWAAPTRVLWPDNPPTIASGRPASRAIALKMRGTWQGCSRAPMRPPLSTERNSMPSDIPAARPSHARTSRTVVPADPDDLAPALAIGLGAAHQQAAVSGQFLKQVNDLQ